MGCLREKTLTFFTQLFSENLTLTVPISEIDRSHRTGKRNLEKPRSIIIKFVNYHVRKNVLHNRGLLKNTGIRITEDLTFARSQLLRKAVAKWGVRNVWTIDGKIFMKINGKVHVIESASQLEQLLVV